MWSGGQQLFVRANKVGDYLELVSRHPRGQTQSDALRHESSRLRDSQIQHQRPAGRTRLRRLSPGGHRQRADRTRHVRAEGWQAAVAGREWSAPIARRSARATSSASTALRCKRNELNSRGRHRRLASPRGRTRGVKKELRPLCFPWRRWIAWNRVFAVGCRSPLPARLPWVFAANINSRLAISCITRPRNLDREYPQHFGE